MPRTPQPLLLSLSSNTRRQDVMSHNKWWFLARTCSKIQSSLCTHIHNSHVNSIRFAEGEKKKTYFRGGILSSECDWIRQTSICNQINGDILSKSIWTEAIPSKGWWTLQAYSDSHTKHNNRQEYNRNSTHCPGETLTAEQRCGTASGNKWLLIIHLNRIALVSDNSKINLFDIELIFILLQQAVTQHLL